MPDTTLAGQVGLDDAEIARRRELFGLTVADDEHLALARPAILEELDVIVHEFYERQTSIQEVAAIIRDGDTSRRLHDVQARYVGELFSGSYGKDCVDSRLRIGLVHQRIGVEPKYFFAAVQMLRGILRRALSRRLADSTRLPSTLDARDKLLSFDAELVFEIYMQTVLSQLGVARDQVTEYARDLEEKVAQRTRELAELSRTDALTGLLNRRAFRDDLRTPGHSGPQPDPAGTARLRSGCDLVDGSPRRAAVRLPGVERRADGRSEPGVPWQVRGAGPRGLAGLRHARGHGSAGHLDDGGVLRRHHDGFDRPGHRALERRLSRCRHVRRRGEVEIFVARARRTRFVRLRRDVSGDSPARAGHDRMEGMSVALGSPTVPLEVLRIRG